MWEKFVGKGLNADKGASEVGDGMAIGYVGVRGQWAVKGDQKAR